MITLIEASNFRSLNYVSQPLGAFHVLVGPNASGKTTFLDVVSFLADIVAGGIDSAIEKRASNLTELTFLGKGGDIQLAIEAGIPRDIYVDLDKKFTTIRYEVVIGSDEETGENAIKHERVILLKGVEYVQRELFLFPEETMLGRDVFGRKYSNKSYRLSVSKTYKKTDRFYNELSVESGKGWIPSFNFGIKRSALGNLPEDKSKFPASTWLKNLLEEGVQTFVLNSLYIRRPSRPGQSLRFQTDGSNLPWVIDDLFRTDETQFSRWLSHVKTALPDIESIETIERPEDRNRYLRIKYSSGALVPSWLVSDGTLRLLALTLPAYLESFKGVYLIEEPENGIHPRAMETILQSLSSVYNAQILMATHSPVILNLVNLDQVLCFAKAKAGFTDVVLGSSHPMLRKWHGEVNLSDLYASGVLG